ncbi:MAG: hypothetical protein AAGA03_18955, partial [Planctomycetota bacterium]
MGNRILRSGHVLGMACLVVAFSVASLATEPDPPKGIDLLDLPQLSPPQTDPPKPRREQEATPKDQPVPRQLKVPDHFIPQPTSDPNSPILRRFREAMEHGDRLPVGPTGDSVADDLMDVARQRPSAASRLRQAFDSMPPTS